MSKSNQKNRTGHIPMDVTLMYRNINIIFYKEFYKQLDLSIIM